VLDAGGRVRRALGDPVVGAAARRHDLDDEQDRQRQAFRPDAGPGHDDDVRLDHLLAGQPEPDGRVQHHVARRHGGQEELLQVD
jgi:hypothetical protein